MKNRRLLLSAAAIAASAGMAHAQSFAEGFESTAAGGYPATWVNNNQSVPGPGLVTWNVQNPGGVFPAHTGTAMLSVNYNSGTGLSTLSNWLILPQVTLTNGDTFSFWTQTNPAQVYPDRLQVRMSLAGASTNSGTSETDVGDFSNLLLDINPTYTTTGYPGTWTQYTATVSGLGAPTSGRIAFRYFVENGGPSGANSDYIGVDDVIYNSVNSVSGACCAPSGTCSLVSSVACATVGGVYRGDNTTCANANCPQPPVFTMTCGVQGTFTDISTTGTLITDGDDSVAPFVSSVTNALVTNPNLNACTNGFVSDSATYNAYTNSTLPVGGIGLGLWVNWDDLFADPGVGKVLHQAVVENGVNVEVIEWYNVRTFAGGAGSATGNFEIKIFGAGGPALVQYLYQDMSFDQNGASSTVGVQWSPTLAFTQGFNSAGSISNNSVCSITQVGGAVCYANCDHSTQVPCLNVLDFGCFLNKFSAGDTYANCDNSTQAPVLNVLDFGCFLNKFAAGCSSC